MQWCPNVRLDLGRAVGGLAHLRAIMSVAAPRFAVFEAWAPRTSTPCSFITYRGRHSVVSVRMPNRLHRYYGAGYLHFITTSCYQRRALVAGPPKPHHFFLFFTLRGFRCHFVTVFDV